MFSRWRSKKRSGKDGEKRGNFAALERRTADIREKLARLSIGSGFRRHSAPAQPSQSCEDFANDALHYGSRGEREHSDPVVLSQLPAPILENILDHLSLKVILNSRIYHELRLTVSSEYY